MAVLENVKKLLSINDDKQDELLEIIINNTEKRLSLLPVDIEEVPERLEYIIEEVSVKRFNRVGAEGMTQESVDGRSNTFQNNDFDEYLMSLTLCFLKIQVNVAEVYLLRYNKRVSFSKETKGSYNPKTSKYDVKEKVLI